ncbi:MULTISPECIES: hypothetical protein [Parafrankia]|uniref:hypothetical protein n=1 Tax=Parafrankia TaxID=2994362 RepID=UPI0034D4C6E9
MRITAPRAPGPAGRPLRAPVRDVDSSAGVREVYLRSLLRVQRRLAVGVLAAVALPLAAVPLAFAAVPALSSYRLGGLPLPWLVLGLAIHPLLFAASVWYVRRAEQTEVDFTALLSADLFPTDPPSGSPLPIDPPSRE